MALSGQVLARADAAGLVPRWNGLRVADAQLCAGGVDSAAMGWASRPAAEPCRPCLRPLEIRILNVPACCITPAVRPTALAAFSVAFSLTITLAAGCASAPEVLGPLRAETVVGSCQASCRIGLSNQAALFAASCSLV